MLVEVTLITMSSSRGSHNLRSNEGYRGRHCKVKRDFSMRKLASVGLAATVLIAASLCYGQGTQPSQGTQPGQGTQLGQSTGATEADQGNPSLSEGKRRACHQEGMSKSMRGPDLQDYVAVCALEARLTCLKQAVAQKVRGPERKDFMTRCMAS